MSKYWPVWLLLSCCGSMNLGAAPLCSDIFTNPPTGNHFPNGLVPPTGLPSLGNLSCGTSSCNRTGGTTFTPGDYSYNSGDMNKTVLKATGVTTRLYFNNLTLTNVSLNLDGNPEDLIIYVAGSLSIAGQNKMNGILYVAGSLSITGSAGLSGAVASGGAIDIGGNSDVVYDSDAVNNADFNGMCDGSGTSSILHHYEFDYSASPLTCKVENISIRACSDASCSQRYPDAFSANLSPNPVPQGGWYQTGSTTAISAVNFVNGEANVDLRHNVTSAITIGASSINPTATSPTLCRSGAGALSSAACTLSFVDSGFIIDVPDKLANKPQNATISAVRKSDSSLDCVPTFANQVKSVDLWAQYIDPVAAAIIGPSALTVNSAAISSSSASPTAANLSFDNAGKASISVNYPDAGKVALNAKYTGMPGTPDAGLVLSGADSFVSFPVGLCVSPQDTTAVCTAGNASCARYKKAGESFGLTVSAKAWVSGDASGGVGDYCDNPNTPNYVQSGIVLGSELVAPSGGVSGLVGFTSYNHQATVNNLNSLTQSIDEVGVFNFTAQAPSSYLGSSFYPIPLATSAHIGRFVPDRFVIENQSVLPECSNTFTYLGQPFSTLFTAKAVNVLGQLTQNYRDEFAKASAVLVGENSDDGIDMQTRLNDVVVPLQSPSWSVGSATIDYHPVFARLPALVGGEVDGPYADMMIGLKVLDNDGNVSTVDSPDMNAATIGDCASSTSCDAKRLSVMAQDFRHGRVVLDNTFGPETEVLVMPVRAEYWNGSHWQNNTDDSCSVPVSTALLTQVDNISLGYDYNPDLVAGQSILRSGQVPKFTNGEFTLLWHAQSTGSTALYRGQATAPLSVSPWLEWYWNWDESSPTLLSAPRASAFFGRYRGHDKIIYWRELN